MKSVLSVDVAKNKSMFLLMSSDGQVLMEPIELQHNYTNFNLLKERITAFKLQDLTVFMESTSTYHLPIERYFSENGFSTLIINSLETKNNFNSLRKTKTDKKDCLNLAKLFFLKEYENHNLPKNDIYYNLKTLSRQYFFLIQSNVANKNRLKRLINLTFSEFEDIFKNGKIFENTALNFIQEFPHVDIVKDSIIEELTDNLFKTNERHVKYYIKLATKIKEFSSNSYPGIEKDNEDVANLVCIAKLVQENIQEIDKLREKMINLARQSPLFPVITSYYGIGELSASEILAELGDIRRFGNTKELIAFCGLDPTIIQSGKTINKRGPISKRGDKYIRKILFNICLNLIMISAKSCPEHPVNIYYRKKKEEGKHHYECIIGCCTKVLRALFAMCKNNTNWTLN